MKSVIVKIGLAVLCVTAWGNIAQAQTYEQAVQERDTALAELEALVAQLEAGDEVDPLEIALQEQIAESWVNYVRLHELVAYLEPAYQEILRSAGSIALGGLKWIGNAFRRH